MIRAFLSHSSKDKNTYARIVAEKLGSDYCVYDEYTFESGMRTIDEIVKGLNDSQLFVVLLSHQALESDWVKKELLLAHEKLTSHEIERIYPIIIDPSLTHLDKRLPQWMRDEYNLKYVSRPVVAARRVKQRLREISWLIHPRKKQRDEIFVGRNELIKLVEERVDDFDKELPICFIASGLPHIGRSAFLKHALVKSNIIQRQSYEWPSIVMRREESLEDLILQLYGLGFSALPYPDNLLTLQLEKKLDIATSLINEIQDAKEIILIRDEGCIIDYTRKIQSWFEKIIEKISKVNQTTFVISARYRPAPETIRHLPSIFAVEVPELAKFERRGYFKRLIELEPSVALTRDDFAYFDGLFQGYPEQVSFADDLIRDLGVKASRNESHQITEYSLNKASIVLEKYSEHKETLDLLFLLSEFEFISLDFLFTIVDEKQYGPQLSELVASSVCDFVGVEKEFIRLNDTIRDYVRRNRMTLPEGFKEKLKEHLDKFLKSTAANVDDVSDVSYSIKEAIKTGKIPSERFLIPSHFLNSMRELYRERGHLDRVIQLADMLLAKEDMLDPTVIADVRYYLCLSLARKRDSRILKEVQKINGPEHNFLLGFYYRLQRRTSDAIEQLKRCLDYPPISFRAKQELVRVYLSIEDYPSAIPLARATYEENPRNAYNIQAYFTAIVNSGDSLHKKEQLQALISDMSSIKSDMANEMALLARAEFLSKVENKYQQALDIINDAIQKYPDSHYPVLSKAFIAARERDLGNLKTSYEKLEILAKRKTISEEGMSRLKAQIMALEGDIDGAVAYAEKKLTRCPDSSRQSFVAKLKDLA